MELRELRGDDLFALLAIFGKLDIVDEIVDIFQGIDTADLTAEEIEKRGKKVIGDLLGKLLKNIGMIKVELNTLLADLTGTTVKEVGALSLAAYTKLIKDFISKPEFKDFLSSIA
ncbi:hypothetical protein [Bacillus cereus]|nr:hypothetical protein [Bacillus cereus]